MNSVEVNDGIMFTVVDLKNTTPPSPEEDSDLRFKHESGEPQVYPLLRRSHTKSRNGCLNCKLRRLKCDESKPQCMKCTKSRKSKLRCEYPAISTPDTKSDPAPLVRNRYSVIVPRTKEIPVIGPSSARLIEPVQALFQNQTDSQYFTFFISKTARNLSGCFDDEIWNRLILQSCHEEEFARHAVVSIAALHKTASANIHTMTEHHTYALQKYAKALKLMRESLISDVDSIKTDDRQLRRALISSLLTTCFESFHGNQTASLSQACSAIRLLHSRESALTSKTGNSTIDQDLLSIFARLELSSLTFTQQEIVPQDNTPKGLSDDHILSSIPSTFESLREARFYWDILARRCNSWRASYGFAFYSPASNLSPISIPSRSTTVEHVSGRAPDLMPYSNDVEAAIRTPVPPHRLKRLEEQLSSYWQSLTEWSTAFAPLYEKIRSGNKNSIEYQGVTMLKIGMLAAGITSAVKNPKTEDSFSAHLLTLIKEILAWEKSRRQPEEGNETVFIFDAGILVHLFIAATRSHDRFARREAVEIMRICNRREGLIDSVLCYKICVWLEGLDHEEDRRTGEVARRKARLVVQDEEFDFVRRRCRFRCRRIDQEGVVYTPVLTLPW